MPLFRVRLRGAGGEAITVGAFTADNEEDANHFSNIIVEEVDSSDKMALIDTAISLLNMGTLRQIHDNIRKMLDRREDGCQTT